MSTNKTDGSKITKPGEQIAEIKLSENGIQFKWIKTQFADWTQKQIANRFFLAKLCILIDGEPYTKIALWEPYDTSPNNKRTNPGVFFDAESRVSHEFIPHFGQLQEGNTQQDILFVRPQKGLGYVEEHYYLLNPADSSDKLLLLEKPAARQ
jgi:hypothetical protein